MRRLIYIDNLRGFLILLVILGHSLQDMGTGNENVLFRVIYAFHIPLFMAVSGYVSYRSHLEWHKLIKMAKQLLVPFFVWAVVSCFLVGDAKYYWEIIKYPDRGLWFLYALYFISLLLTCCDWIAMKTGILLEIVVLVVAVISSAIVLVFGFKLFGFQLISYHFVFYSAGFFAHKYQIPEIMHKNIALPLVLLFVVLTFGSGMSIVPQILGLQDNAFAVNVLDDLCQYVVGLTSIPVGLYVFKNALWGGRTICSLGSEGRLWRCMQ